MKNYNRIKRNLSEHITDENRETILQTVDFLRKLDVLGDDIEKAAEKINKTLEGMVDTVERELSVMDKVATYSLYAKDEPQLVDKEELLDWLEDLAVRRKLDGDSYILEKDLVNYIDKLPVMAPRKLKYPVGEETLDEALNRLSRLNTYRCEPTDEDTFALTLAIEVLTQYSKEEF